MKPREALEEGSDGKEAGVDGRGVIEGNINVITI